MGEMAESNDRFICLILSFKAELPE